MSRDEIAKLINGCILKNDDGSTIYAARILAALDAAGLVIVPAEPTEAMKEAGQNPPHDLVYRDSRAAEAKARAAAVYSAHGRNSS